VFHDAGFSLEKYLILSQRISKISQQNES